MNVLHFALSGLLGAALYVLVWSKGWRDLVRYESFRHLAVGVLSGVFYFLLCSNHGFPDSVMAVVVGYFGPDFLQGIMDKLRAFINERW
ncbi:MAG: hypothetical protein QXD75_04670 [Desulfurococcaceae archaeon]